MEFENEEFSVIVPEYLVNSEQNENQVNEENENQVNEENENQVDEENENQVDEQNENQVNEQNIDYSSILEEMNTRLTNIESNTVNYTEALQGILTNMYFLDFVGFTFFIFVLLVLVIKFFKIFF